MTLRKTAAELALGARCLARKDVTCMLMALAGAMGLHLIRAHKAIRPSIGEVTIRNRTEDKAKVVIAELEGEPGMRDMSFQR